MIGGQTQDQRSPERRLIELEMAHADLNALIDHWALHPGTVDELRIQRLKKQRLALRDEIKRLHWLLDPKEPA